MKWPANTSSMSQAGRAPSAAHNSPGCSRMQTAASSISCCSGRSTAFRARGWCKRSCTWQCLDSYGVKFHSYTEAHLNTDNELVRNVLLAVLSSLAKTEAQKISERTKAGLERARRRGARIGRPQLEESLRSEITQRLADGATPFAVARALVHRF